MTKEKKLKPLLAFNENPDLDKLAYPVIASPKLDGFRVWIPEGKLVTRSMKPLPNNYTRIWLEENIAEGLDGELLIKNGTFNDCQSAFMKVDGEPDFEYWVFDKITNKDYDEPFKDRLANLQSHYTYMARTHHGKEWPNRVKLVPQVVINSADEMREFEAYNLEQGYEGSMIRKIDGKYKQGRSTLNEAILLKLKLWEDTEGEILYCGEQMENTNEKTTNELGHSQRSSHQAGMVPKNTLGYFWVRNLKTGVEHKVGTGKGMTNLKRQEIWDKKDEYVGQVITYKFQPHGTKDKPRLPVWKGFRHADDYAE